MCLGADDDGTKLEQDKDSFGETHTPDRTEYDQQLFTSSEHPTIPPVPDPDPDPDRSASGNTFKCPYCHCHILIDSKNKNEWARHIFHDIIPYICVLDGCKTNWLFQSRQEWNRHINKFHSSRSMKVCPLCKEDLGVDDLGVDDLDKFETHVAFHLERLALIAIGGSKACERTHAVPSMET